MDKETLSHYGWIVVLVLILAVLLALASPFGSFIADGFRATYAGFKMVGDKALGIVIPGSGNGENNGNTGDVSTDNTTISVPGLGEVEVDNPNIKLTYNPNTGETSGVIPPSNEPETPVSIPSDKLPEIIEFGYGKFESKAKYTPGTYETVPYETTSTRHKLPVSYHQVVWSKWYVTRDAYGNITSVEPMDIELADIYEKDSTYILYDFETYKYSKLEGVEGDTVELWTIHNDSEDTLDNIIYLAAYLNKVDENTNRHIAKWDGTKYVAVDYDAEVNAVDTFTETYTVTGTKQVQITAPSASFVYVYVPVGTMQAEEGMTWAEWLASDYNTTGETAPTIKTADFEDVSYDDVIVAGESYGFATYKLNGCATFSDGVTLSWEELMLEENGLKYGYGGRLGNMYLGTGIDETGIAENVFAGCTSLTGIVIPDSCYIIDESAFFGCSSLTTVHIPDSIGEIRERVFAGCSSLTSIDIHSNITKISYDAFAGSNLSTINYAGTKAQWNNITKLDRWNLDCGEVTGEITVHCTNGTLIETPSSFGPY